MSVTVLFLVIFEAESDMPEFEQIETFLIYECVILIIDLLFFLFRSGKHHSTQVLDAYETMGDRWNRMSRLDICNSLISLVLYLAQISWLIYGNYIYFNLPVNIPGLYEQEEAAGAHFVESESEINSEKWLYIALMTVLTIGYVHLMIFASLIVIFIVYSFGKMCLSEEDAHTHVGHLSPVKLWLFIDEGIFSLLDDIDDPEIREQEVQERREEVERRLALEKLDEKPYETVR